jgi:hypothetical protein
LDAEQVLDSADSLSIFGAEEPDCSSPTAGRLSLREIANALDLFPSEAEELAAESEGAYATAASPDPLAEFDSDIDEDIVIVELVMPGRAPVHVPWALARIAVMVAFATVIPSTRAADRHVTRRPIATSPPATIVSTSVRSVESHPVSTDRQTPAILIPVADARPKIPATAATTGQSSSRPRADRPRAQRNTAPLTAVASDRLVTIAPTALSRPDVAPIDPPPPLPRTAPPAHVEMPPSPTVVPSPNVVAPEPSVVRNDSDAVRAVLDRYQTAFSHLDASIAKAIWPSVDEKALGRAFGQLERQQVLLEGCDVKVVGERAAAACGGRASYVPRVGNKAARVESRRWAFTLRKTGESWIIEAVDLASR